MLTTEEMARGVRSQVKCFPTDAEALASIGFRVMVTREGTQFQPTARATSMGYFGIALHWKVKDGWLATDPRIQALKVAVNTCDGGGVNLVGTGYENEVKSTESPCSRTKHYDLPDYTGDLEVTGVGDANLTTSMVGRVSAIRYFSA